MRPIITAEMVNGAFGDPALYLDFRFERRALLLDLGDIAVLPPRKILRLSDVFVSHAHMDHFSGFDRLVRVSLGRGGEVRLYGPPGFIDRVERGWTLGELKTRALQIVPGQKLAYVTDIVYSAQNEARVARLAADADLLFIESVFLSSEAQHAARKLHLTAAQAGRIARTARARAVIPFHFSPRYLGREAELRAELERARSGI